MRTALLVLFLLVFAPNAHATTLDMPDGPARSLYQSWTDNSALPTPIGAVPVVLGECGDGLMTCLREDGIHYPDVTHLANYEEWGDYGREQLAENRTLFLHELAHVLDKQLNGAGRYRRMFRRILGPGKVVAIRGGWWAYGFIPDSETFADAYAYCATAPHVLPRDQPYSGYGTYRPTDRQHQVICHMLDIRLAVGLTQKLGVIG